MIIRLCVCVLFLLQWRISGSGEDQRRHRGVQEGDGRLVGHVGSLRHVERLRVQQPRTISCGGGHGGVSQICESPHVHTDMFLICVQISFIN